MDKIILSDNEKKESRIWFILMIFTLIIGIGGTIVFGIQSAGNKTYNIVLLLLITIVVFSFCLYCFLCCFLYKLEVTADKITVKTLLKTNIILFSDNFTYSYKKYTKFSEFYIFSLFVNGHKIQVYTRFYKEFNNILKDKANIIEKD